MTKFRIIPATDRYSGLTEYRRPDGSTVAAMGVGREVEEMLKKVRAVKTDE